MFDGSRGNNVRSLLPYLPVDMSTRSEFHGITFLSQGNTPGKSRPICGDPTNMFTASFPTIPNPNFDV